MLFVCFALLCLTQSLLAVELSIYNSFTQIRQLKNGVGDYTYAFKTADYTNIIDGSINWEGTPFVRQEIYNTIQSLQDVAVTLRRSTACECETIQAKIVDPNTMLLQNLKTGAYFYADKQSIEYTSTRPNDGGMALTFRFPNQNTEYNGTLSYLMRGISWKPNYDLLLIGTNDCKLRAYANIKNDQQQEYTVENTDLLGGDIQLAGTTSTDSIHGMEFSRIPTLKPITETGEHRGLYSYSLKDKYTLRPSSSIRLPFIDVAMKYQFYYKAMTSISTDLYQGVFLKSYDLTPDHFMPAGIITIRDNQVLVGQSYLPDVPANRTQTITVGQDNDVRYSIKSNLTLKSNETAPIQTETYEVDVQLMNYKNKNVNAELVLQAGIQMTVLNTTCKSAKSNGNQLSLPMQLEPGENRLCKLTVTVRFS